MDDVESRYIVIPGAVPCKIVKWKVKLGARVGHGTVLLLYNTKSQDDKSQDKDDKIVKDEKLKATSTGTVKEIFKLEGDWISAGESVCSVEACKHPIVMREMCAECGADLRTMVKPAVTVAGANVAMVHSIPDLVVNQQNAQELGRADEDRLLVDRKLVLLVDLDQTLIHTTNDNIPPNLKDVYHFQLYGSNSPWYHTRLRPGTFKFLQDMSSLFELHICTFGVRIYAHQIAHFLDRDGKYFSSRILSRDECFNPTSKTANLKALFPCGDNMVVIIDDREDVWNFAANLIHVKPYHFFKNTGDINAPPGMDKQDDGDYQGFKIVKKKEPKEEENEIVMVDVEGDEKVISDNKAVDEEEEDVEVEKMDEVEPSKLEDVEEKKDPEAVVEEKDPEAVEEKKDETENLEKETTSADKDPGSQEADKVSEEIGSKPKEEEEEDSSDSGKSVDMNIPTETAPVKKNEEDELIEVEDTDDYLLHLQDILVRIHKTFYDLHDVYLKDKARCEMPDMKDVIPRVRSTVLEDVSIVFSGCVRKDVSLEDSKPYQIAKSLGAQVSLEVISEGRKAAKTTHLVAARLGTNKERDARRFSNITVVTPDWLWSCAERWEHVDERLFPLKKNSKVHLEPPLHCNSNKLRGLQHMQSAKFSDSGESNDGGDEVKDKRERTVSFSESINPFMSFSRDDLDEINKEVDSMLDESDSLPSGAEDMTKAHEESSSRESLTGPEHPQGWKEKNKRKREDSDKDSVNSGSRSDPPYLKLRKGIGIPEDFDLESDSSDSTANSDDDDDDDDEDSMGKLLEKELLNF